MTPHQKVRVVQEKGKPFLLRQQRLIVKIPPLWRSSRYNFRRDFLT